MTATTRAVMAWAAVLAGFLRAGDWWVDSLGSGDGTSQETPMSSVQGAIDAAGVGDTIHIHGGEGRVYTNTLYTVNKTDLTLRDWEGKPLFQVLGTGDRIDARLMEIAASGVTVLNLRFELQGTVLGSGGEDVVEITTDSGSAVHNVTLDGCEFRMTAFGGAWNQGSPIMQGTSPYGTNLVVRNCLFRDWDRDGDTGDGYRLNMVYLNGERCQIVDNVFTNTSRILSGGARYYRFSGNRIFNCRNSRKPYNDANSGGMLQSGYNALRDGEISHNIVWNDNGKQTSFLNKVREGFTGDTRIFNNTVYGADSLVGAIYYSDGTRWSPKIYNNLLINNAYTNIYGIGASSPFLSTTEIKNNLWYGGANELVDPPSVGITPVDCYNVPCAFVNTTDTGSPDFLRPDGNQTPQAMQGIGGDYPTYIGAVEPKFGNPATLILLR